jgi:signal transduction histidine kinase
MLFIPIFLISWFLKKTKFQFDLVMILSGICAYGAYIADLMTKSTPNWGHLRSNVPFIIGFIIVGLLNIISVLNITVLITKKKILEPLHNAIEQKNEIEKNLMRQRKELSQFAHMMAHDLRSNLTSIKGYTELMSKESDKNNSQVILEKIKQIQNLLETSVKLADSGKIIDNSEYVDLHALTSEIVETIVPKHIIVNIDGLPSVYADKYRLYQVLKNIIENAVIHGNPDYIKILSKNENGNISISIENDGNSISKEFIEDFHNDNFSIDFNKKGIGLKIVKRIIEAHNWKITINDEPFTTFTINIPVNNFKG